MSRAAMYTSVIIKVDGTRITQKHPAAPPLAFLQKAVGGYVETLAYFTKLSGTPAHHATAYCNEDGLSKGLAHNVPASAEYNQVLKDRFGEGKASPQYLVGDIVIYWKDPVEK